LAIALDSQPAIFRTHYHHAISCGHVAQGLKLGNWNHGYVADFHPDGHSVLAMKQGNLTLAKKNGHFVGFPQEGSRGALLKCHAARATERNHGNAIAHLEAVTAKKRGVRQKRLAAHAGVGAALHQSDNWRTGRGQWRSNE
jgi:hypothetical protein